MKVIIIDDEDNNIENLQQLLQVYCPEVRVVGTAANSDDGIALINQIQPDLVFLDIEMPGKNGFELLKSLSAYNFEIIFVTAHHQYGIQAVKFAAIDYILKPIDIEELKTAVAKALKKRTAQQQNLQLENLIQILQQQQVKTEHRIALPTAKETRFAKTEEIIRCESSNTYTTFFLVSGEKIMVSKPIYEFEELLADYQFIRCHQSHIVNKKFIKSWVKANGGHLLLYDKTEVPVSRQKREELKDLF
ncbi:MULTISPECIES: LytR/AlgR family response regulator transcription factor [Niastella]|uniref:Response regulator transcription factor n=1 Tax=Niastella soli TaxID=2821487 RepID=A0ABS3Z2P5_9BACT|nr:LytTR family DNA-binding domain-containing protein [Niastella soli]MBO9204441.1 response regulator transcription factor [Niastella soli]